MKSTKLLGLVLGAVLAAATLFALVAVPGLVSDQDSTVPLTPAREARR